MEKVELKVEWNLDFKFKNLKGKDEPDNVFPAYEMVSEYLARIASDTKDKRAKLFNFGMKAIDKKQLVIEKKDVEMILEILVTTNMSNLYYQQLEASANEAIEAYEAAKKEKKEIPAG